MGYEIRSASADEMDQIGLMAAYVYGGEFGDSADNVTSSSLNPDWTLCAFEGAKLVTSFAAFPFTMRANGVGISFAGITAVGTLPEHRRQGLVRRIITESFVRQRDQGQSVAGLWASQAAIYQRYGFVAAGANRSYKVDTVDIRFPKETSSDVSVERLPIADALEHARAVYRDFITDRFGYLHRSQVLWRLNVFEESENGPVHCAIAFNGSEPCGYVVYTLRSSKVNHVARGQEIVIKDLAWLNVDAYQSLWEYLSHHDLVGRVSWSNAPVDDPAPQLVIEPRLLHCHDLEGSWMRVVDVPTALSKRGYVGDGSLNIAVNGDDIANWNNETWQLEVGAGEALAKKTTASPDVSLDISALSALYTGAASARSLSQIGKLDADLRVIEQLDQMFATHWKPHCPDHY
jgi:predicted acetyltransferase